MTSSMSNVQGFVKSAEVSCSGLEKAAVLLAELSDGADKVLAYLSLSDYEKTKIRKAMQKLGKYDPNNMAHVKREQAVLKEALEYGRQKNILSSKPVLPAEERDKNKDFWQTVRKDPKKVADLLGAWINDKE